MGIKDLAAKAKEKLTGGHSGLDESLASTADKLDNATGDRFGDDSDWSQDAFNQRLDDYTAARHNMGRNMEPGG
jgi:hypothetical protein